MKLSSFRIENYRSIKKTEEIYLNKYNVIVGKNNSGKTNILNALNLGIKTISSYATRETRTYIKIKDRYDYFRDFPLELQKDNKKETSTIELEFELSESLKKKFTKETGLSNSGAINIQIKYNKENRAEIKFLKVYGKGALNYTRKRSDIFKFIIDHFEFIYIPALRPEEESINIIYELVNEELNNIELNPTNEEYRNALKVISEKEQEIVKGISSRILRPLQEFLPELIDTDITINSNRNKSYFRRDIGFYINDGNWTELNFKGDGIKSLVSVALINSLSSTEKSRLVAIEEPESHLHPEAIHQLNKVIKEISEKSNVLITTHNPIFINSIEVKSNFIVHDGVLKSATNIKEIRKTLGTKISDSLFLSENIIIVEGHYDKAILDKILTDKSNIVKQAVENKKLAFYPLDGANKLSPIIPLMESFLINYLIILDYDETGRGSLESAMKRQKIESKRKFFYIVKENGDSEFEDLLSNDYLEELLKEEGINGRNYDFKNLSWSERNKHIFRIHGRIFDKDCEYGMKEKIKKLIINTTDYDKYFKEEGLNIINQIIKRIENMILE